MAGEIDTFTIFISRDSGFLRILGIVKEFVPELPGVPFAVEPMHLVFVLARFGGPCNRRRIAAHNVGAACGC